jgi:osmotically-inducible protein OsmY
VRSTRAFLIGAGAAYLFDPRQGRRRRHVLRDRTAAVARHGARLGTRKARFAGGHLRGLVAVTRRLSGHSSAAAADDLTVIQRIRSDAFREAGVSTRDVEVEIEDGVATLRGSVGSRTRADNLVANVAKVPGVRDVAAMIRVSSADQALRGMS